MYFLLSQFSEERLRQSKKSEEAISLIEFIKTMDDDLLKTKNFIIEKKILSKKQTDKLFAESVKNNIDIFDVIINNKILEEENAIKLKAEFLNVPYADLKDETLDAQILKEVPKKAAIFYKFIPFGKKGNVVRVGMINPKNIDALDALKFISVKNDIDTEIYIISRKSFNEALKQYGVFGEELKTVLKNVSIKISKKAKEERKKELGMIMEKAPVSKIVDIIISHAIEGKASDIHIEPTQKELRVRYRLDGVLYDGLVLPVEVGPAISSRVKILSDLKIDENRKPQDGRFRFETSGRSGVKNIDLRVSTFPTVNGEKIVMRLLDSSSDISTLDNLGIMGMGLEKINKNINKPFGIILVTGPTGSGKSTTLYSILKILNKEGVNIVTLEDPVEYYLYGINQSQVHPEIGYSFSSGLRHILRQDPDIVMVGEIRDKETAELAMHAALTGHLVLSTLHTNNAIGVIPRLVDMGIEPFLISSALNIAIGQRLVRRICDSCKKEISATPAMKKLVEEELKYIPEDQKKDIDFKGSLKFYKGEGCDDCKKVGTSGRIGIYEVLLMSVELETIMSSKVTENEILKEAKRQGMITMKQDGILKALRGFTTIEEVLRATQE